jgi:hypothetical protein
VGTNVSMNKPDTTNATTATTIAGNSVEIAIDGDDGPDAAVLGCNDKPAMAAALCESVSTFS